MIIGISYQCVHSKNKKNIRPLGKDDCTLLGAEPEDITTTNTVLPQAFKQNLLSWVDSADFGFGFDHGERMKMNDGC